MNVDIPASLDEFPQHREKVELICRAAAENADIIGMAIGGSTVVGSFDVYSDVDLKIVVEDDAFDEVLEQRATLIDAAGNAVASFTGEHVGLPELVIVLYDDLVHVDFGFVRGSAWPNFDASVAPHAILWQRGSALAEAMERKTGDGPVRELTWLEARMWTWVRYIHSKILRGELYEALDGLQFLRSRVLFSLLAMNRGVPPAGSRRAEAIVVEAAESFAATVSTHDRDSCMHALQTSVDLYLKFADPLLDTHEVKVEEPARRVVLAALEQGTSWRPSQVFRVPCRAT